MLFRIAADSALLLHLAFILFVVFGAVLVVRWRWLMVLHLPAVAWGIFIELTGGICPLTYLENDFRRSAGQAGFSESFIEHYLLKAIYPEGLTAETQTVFGGLVLVVNLLLYSRLIWNRSGRHSSE